MNFFLNIIRTLIVIVLSVIVTTLAINATDFRGNLKNSLLGAVILSEKTTCPDGMVELFLDEKTICIDQFEASPSEECPHKNPSSIEETKENLDNPGCRAVSNGGKDPWRFIARHQALIACAKDGKRLPTSMEWYRGALGTPDPDTTQHLNGCHVKSSVEEGPVLTGSRVQCASSFGVYDMVGNVWEWVDGDITNGVYEERTIPDSGYVKEIDSRGVAIKTDGFPDPIFNNDYFWAEHTDVRGLIRGGYWGNDSDAGYYAANAVIPPSFSGTGVGFRCVKEAVE